jgi:cell wall assembly regulator SMI1
MNGHDAVRELRARKLELARLDPRGGMPIRPPVGAAEADLARVERRLGRALPPSYRALLASQDGWPRFLFGASLLGAESLARGTYVDLARLVFADAAIAPEGDAAHLGPRSAFVPFGIDADGETLFAWDLTAEREDGELGVIMLTNDVADRLEDFPAFLEVALDLVEAEIAERRAQPRRELGVVREPTGEGKSRAA